MSRIAVRKYSLVRKAPCQSRDNWEIAGLMINASASAVILKERNVFVVLHLRIKSLSRVMTLGD